MGFETPTIRADAPSRDPDGNRFLIRFKRKEKTHYLVSESDGEKKSWSAVFESGKWVMSAKGGGRGGAKARRSTKGREAGSDTDAAGKGSEKRS